MIAMPGGVRVACREIRLARRSDLAQTTRPEDASLASTRMSYSSCRSSGFHNSRTNCLFTLKLVIWACPVAMSAEGTDLPVRGPENFGQLQPLRHQEFPQRTGRSIFLHPPRRGECRRTKTSITRAKSRFGSIHSLSAAAFWIVLFQQLDFFLNDAPAHPPQLVE